MQTFDIKRFGLKVGDRVKPTKEYEDLFDKSFYGDILFFEKDCALVIRDNGERLWINCYWLEKEREKANP